jgi:predicted dehydrogenase
MGNQGRSSPHHRVFCEWIWNGAIGKITEAHAWSGAGGWAKGKGRPKDTPAIPEGFDWELWLGPKPSRPYHPAYAPYNWRGWWAFGTGAVGDMMIHNIDPMIGALDPGAPDTVECLKTDFVDDEVIGGNNHVVWKYPKKGLTVYWHDGRLRPQKPEELGGRGLGGNGILLIGDKGKIHGGGWSKSPRIIPEEKMREYQEANKGKTPARTMPKSKGHHRDWLDACKGGKPARSNFEYGAKLTEFVLLGDVSIRAKQKIEWDGENMKVKNVPEAQKFVQEEYRKGWDLEKA